MANSWSLHLGHILHMCKSFEVGSQVTDSAMSSKSTILINLRACNFSTRIDYPEGTNAAEQGLGEVGIRKFNEKFSVEVLKGII